MERPFDFLLSIRCNIFLSALYHAIPKKGWTCAASSSNLMPSIYRGWGEIMYCTGLYLDHSYSFRLIKLYYFSTMMSNDDNIQIVPQMEAPADDDSFNRDACEDTRTCTSDDDNDNANDDTTAAARQVLDQATSNRQTALDGPLSSSSSSEQHNLQTAVQLGSMTADVANSADELSAVMDEYDVGSISGVETQIQMLDREKLWGPSIVGTSRPTSTADASFRSNITGPSKDDTGVGGRLHSSKSSQGGSGRLHTSTSQGSFSKMRNFLTGSFSALGKGGDDGARSQRSRRHQMDPPATQLTESDYPNMMQDEDDDDEYSSASAASSVASSRRNGGGELSASYDDAEYDLHAEQLAKLSASSRSSTRGRRGGRMWRGDSAIAGTDRTGGRGTKQMARRTSYNSAYTNAYTVSSYARGDDIDVHGGDEHDIESGGDGSLLERVDRATSNRTNTSQRSAANSSSRYAASSQQQQQRGAPGVSLAAAAALASEYSQSIRSTFSTVTSSTTSDVHSSVRKNGTANSKVLDWTDAMATSTKIPGQKARRRREIERMCRRRWFVPVILIILILLALLVHFAKLRIRDRHNHGDDISLSGGGGRVGGDSGVTGADEDTDSSIVGGEGVYNLAGGDIIEAFESPTISPAPTPTEQGKNANAITHTVPGVGADTGDREYGSESGTEFTFGSDVTFDDDKDGAEGLVASDASKVDLTWQFDRPTPTTTNDEGGVETKDTSTVVEEITTSSLVLSKTEDGSETSKKLSASLEFLSNGDPVVDEKGRPLDAQGNFITIDDEPVVLQMDENNKPILNEQGYALMMSEDGKSSTPIVTETTKVTKTKDETLNEMFDTQGARPVEVAELDSNVGSEKEDDPIRPVEILEEAPSATEPIVQTSTVQEPVTQTAAEAPIDSRPPPPRETIIKHVYETPPTPPDVPPPAPANYDLSQIFNLMSTLMTATASNQQQPVAVAAPVQPVSATAGSTPAQPTVVRPSWSPAVVGAGYGGFGSSGIVYDQPGPVAVEPYGVLHNAEYLESCRAEYGDNKCFYKDDDSLKLARSREDYAISEIYYSNPIKCCGIVVEIGAGNGKEDSVGHFFEYGMNWRAINIEADPILYQELAVNRPDAENHFGGFCESDHMLHDNNGFHALNGDGEVTSEKLSTTASVDPDKASKVPCLSLEKDVFKSNQITHVDVMVVQGSGEALAIIRKMMWTVRVDIWIILMEESSRGRRAGTNHDKTVSVVLERNEYVKAEWDIARWCGDEPGSCRKQMVYLRKGFNPLPGNVQSSLKRYLRKQNAP